MATVFKNQGIRIYALTVLKFRLEMEAKGLKFRGGSALSVAKKQFGFKGSRDKVLDQLRAYIETEKCKLAPDDITKTH